MRGASDIKVCILRVGGTNCDRETKIAFDDLGATAKVVHLNSLARSRDLEAYDILVFPGGFSFGDYVRAGAILAQQVVSKLGSELRKFIDAGKPVLGVCNGFQVLVEAGLLPGLDSGVGGRQAALATNTSGKYECRWVYLRHEERSRCIHTVRIPKGGMLRIPIGHAEGRFLLLGERQDEYLDEMYLNGQVVLRYSDEGGNPAEGRYPFNPNGALHDIAGISNPEGNVFGLMPHPERAYYGWQLPERMAAEDTPTHGDGRLIFESIVEYALGKV